MHYLDPSTHTKFHLFWKDRGRDTRERSIEVRLHTHTNRTPRRDMPGTQPANGLFERATANAWTMVTVSVSASRIAAADAYTLRAISSWHPALAAPRRPRHKPVKAWFRKQKDRPRCGTELGCLPLTTRKKRVLFMRNVSLPHADTKGPEKPAVRCATTAIPLL